MRPHPWLFTACCLLLATAVGSGFPGSAGAAANTGPLDRGIENLKNIQQKRRTQIKELEEEAGERVGSIAQIIYEAYGQPRDPARLLIELKGVVDEALEGIRAGRMGEAAEALGHASQLALDLWSERNPNIEALNVGQQIAWELAEAGQILRERSARQTEVDRDAEILRWLEAKNEALKSRAADEQNRTPKPPKPPGGDDTTVRPPPRQGLDGPTVDEWERLQRWLDRGNRAFDNRTQEEQFYRDYPMLKPLRDIAETRSPADEAEDMNALTLIEQAAGEARRRRTALKSEDQQRAQAEHDLNDARQELGQAREDEQRASAPQRIAIPEDTLRRAIPSDWVPCQCPGRHPNAGLLIDGARWHTPAIDCSMVF